MGRERLCKHCGSEISNGTDECTNVGWCALIAAGRPDASGEEHLIADAVALFSALDTARNERAQRNSAALLTAVRDF